MDMPTFQMRKLRLRGGAQIRDRARKLTVDCLIWKPVLLTTRVVCPRDDDESGDD